MRRWRSSASPCRPGRARRRPTRSRVFGRRQFERGTSQLNETVVGEKGMVVAPHSAAAMAGAEALRSGGNAIEAIVAAAATIAVVYPHMNGIGGDAFFLIAEPGKAPRAIDACCAAGSLATSERYRKAGYDALPA